MNLTAWDWCTANFRAKKSPNHTIKSQKKTLIHFNYSTLKEFKNIRMLLTLPLP